MKRPQQGARFVAGAVLVTLSLFAAAAPAADARTQARRIHDRLAGVPPSAQTLDQMAAQVASGNARGAADVAMQAPSFYTTVLKNWVTPWTNRDQTAFAPLNDYTATVIGMIRDGVDFRQVLSGDILYVGGAGLPAYSASSNALYEQMEAQDMNLGDGAVLVQSTQSAHTGIPAEATAGVMTTRAAAKAFFVDGTNRAMFRFTLMAHMCRDLEQVSDTTRPPDRIRQDVSRSPGGDSRMYLNNCSGCHSGMDPLAQAFAYYNYDKAGGDGEDGRIVYTPGAVQPKYLINADNFRSGYVTKSDGWDNYWRKGPNQLLGWSSALPGSGSGAKSMGEELAQSEAFARCQVEKVFNAVCLRTPANAADRAKVQDIIGVLKAGNFKMKDAFAETAIYCAGE
ncbi:MAG: hypothetical protein LBE59_03960 [Nevskiaceae bacterium]|jgi:hypothetical protein|nr:hypothetical protein [Nevskiaceae bacterium]